MDKYPYAYDCILQNEELKEWSIMEKNVFSKIMITMKDACPDVLKLYQLHPRKPHSIQYIYGWSYTSNSTKKLGKLNSN